MNQDSLQNVFEFADDELSQLEADLLFDEAWDLEVDFEQGANALDEFPALTTLEAELEHPGEADLFDAALLEDAALEAELLVEGDALLEQYETLAEIEDFADEMETLSDEDALDFAELEAEQSLQPGSAGLTDILALAKQHLGLKITFSY